MIYSILSFFVVFGFLIFIHELGHFLVAKKVGVTVLEFSLGFPPKMFSRMINGTQYVLSWIPLGGYVRLQGQNIEDEDPSQPDNYASKTILQRFFILVSGALMNLIAAFVLLPIVFMMGIELPVSWFESPVIGDIQPGSYAEKLDLRKDDRIVSIDNQMVATWEKADSILQTVKDKLVTLELERDGKFISLRFSGEILRERGFGWSMKTPPLVGNVGKDTPAEKSGLITGDQILTINGVNIADWNQIRVEIQKTNGSLTVFQLQRGDMVIALSLKPKLSQDKKRWVIGISTPTVKHSYGFVQSFERGSKLIVRWTAQTFYFLGTLIIGEGKKDDVMGPIMIAKVVGQEAQKSIINLVRLVAFISLQLGIFNLLPIPALDGGHIFLLLIEKIKGRPLSASFREKTQMIGFSLLILLMIFVTIQDSIKLIS